MLSRVVRSALLPLALLLLVATGCAPTTTTVMDEEVVGNLRPMAFYHRLVVSDFTLQREQYTDSPVENMGDRDRRYAELPDRLGKSIERYVRSRRIYHEVSRGQDAAGDRTLLLTGRFTRVGRFRLSIEGRLLDAATRHEVAYFRQTLWDVLDANDRINELGKEVAEFLDRIQYK